MRQATVVELLFNLGLKSIAWLFVVVGLMKLLNLQGFRSAVVGYQIFGERLSALAATVIPPVEITLGFLLLSGSGGAKVPVTLAILLLAFTVAIGINLAKGQNIDCGCDGGMAPSRITWAHVGRNALLSGGLLWAATNPPSSLALVGHTDSALSLASFVLTSMFIFGKAPLELWRRFLNASAVSSHVSGNR